jgi:hypothetical protein
MYILDKIVKYDENIMKFSSGLLIGVILSNAYYLKNNNMSKGSTIILSGVTVIHAAEIGYIEFMYRKRTIGTELSRLLGFLFGVIASWTTCVTDDVPITNKNGEMSNNYMPLSRDIIEYIKEEGLTILEVCAENGENMRILKNEGVDIESFDMNSSDDISYGIRGSFEDPAMQDLHSRCRTRTLLACPGMQVFDMEKSISRFCGNKVILGAYVSRSSYCIDEYEYIAGFNSLDHSCIPVSREMELKITLLPTYKWMIDNGWEYERAYFRGVGDCKSLYLCFYVFNRKCKDDMDTFDILDTILDEVYGPAMQVCEIRDKGDEVSN